MRAVAQGRCKMRSVKVETANLLRIVKANREKHIAEYHEAVKNYKELALAKVREVYSKAEIELARAAKNISERIESMTEKDIERGQGFSNCIQLLSAVNFNLTVPQSHQKDYDQVISMLDMCVDKEITIMSDEHACYCMDDWDWKQEFQTVSETYKHLNSLNR